MRSRGTFRIPAGVSPSWGDIRLRIAGDSSRSSASLRAAVPRKSGLAKFDHLTCQPAVCARCLGIARVRSHRPTDEWCLAEPDGLTNHVLEDVMVSEVTHLLKHVASEDCPAVVERRQQAEHLESGVQAFRPNLRDHIHQRSEALECVVLRLYRN